MIKKTITFTDYNGTERTEDFYFNLSTAEMLNLEISHVGGLSEWASAMMAAHDQAALYELFENIIKLSYGVKSPDGREFIKSEEITKRFTQTEAYSELLIEFMTNKGSIEQFFNGLVQGAKKPTDQDKPALQIV